MTVQANIENLKIIGKQQDRIKTYDELIQASHDRGFDKGYLQALQDIQNGTLRQTTFNEVESIEIEKFLGASTI